MRPIDADELKALRDLYIQGKLLFDGNEYDLIDKCPTIDVEPVRHSTWNFTPDGVTFCVNCGKSLDLRTLYTTMKFNYCLHCGAKMDGEVRT